MVQQFKESTVVIIDTGRTRTRAGRGLAELLPPPSVSVESRVGIRKADAARLRGPDSQNASSSKLVPPKGARPSNYLVGHRLDNAINAGEDLEIYWPFENGDISDWVQVEALWKYILFDALGLRRNLNEFPVLLSIPKKLSLPSYELLAQLFFERFNVAAFSFSERPLLQLFAANQITGVVVDIDQHVTDISCIIDTFVMPGACVTVPLGVVDCERHLARILGQTTNVTRVLSPPEGVLSPDDLFATTLRLARTIWKTEGIVKPYIGDGGPPPVEVEEDVLNNVAAVLVAGKEKAIIEAGNKKKAAAAKGAAEREQEKQRQAMDLVDIDFEGKKITVGRERHRFFEPLLDFMAVRNLIMEGTKNPETTVTIQSAINDAILALEPSFRPLAWEAIYLTGDLSPIRPLVPAVHTYLAPYITRDPVAYGVAPNGMAFVTDQAKVHRVLRVPEYFANYRERGDELSSFLGASIVAKLTFNDPTGRFVAKSTYSTQGPSAILEFV